VIWTTWRQHRAEAGIATLVMALVGIYLVITGIQMREASQVFLDPKVQQAAALNQFGGRFLNLGILTKYLLMVLPAILGVFVGAPLLAREMEQRTHLVAWAQSITRMRWFITKIVLLSIGTLLGAAALSVLAGWWHSPLDQLFSAGRWIFFDAIGLVPLAYALFGLGLGVTVGTLIRRTVPAMAVTVLLFAVARTAATLLRPWYLPPVVKEVPLGQTFPPGALQMYLRWVDAANHPVMDDRITQLLQQAFPDQASQASQFSAGPGAVVGQATPVSPTQVAQMDQYLHAHGFRYLATFQPDDRFWTFQLIEAAIFFALAVMLFGLSAWWLQSRIR
jgi:hypothetical protein